MQASEAPGKSPLRGRYLVQNPVLWAGLATTDWLLGKTLGRRTQHAVSAEPPRRILLSVGGHLGDLVIASSALPLVKASWPDAEIGLLIGSWSRFVVQDHPSVKWIHTLDHWKLNRTGPGFAGRIRRHLATRRRAIREIRSVGYDLAIDLYPFFPNVAPTLWAAGIPRRIGYESGGFGALLTQAIPWHDAERHMAEYHRDLLHAAGVDPKLPERLRYSLPAGSSGEAVAARTPSERPESYLVVHMGAGLKLKEWPEERWQTLVDRLLEDGHSLVFTGNGAQQAREAELVIGNRSGCENLCDRLSWPEFVDVIRRAQLVVSIDSVAGHIAAAVDTPSVVIVSGINRAAHWKPLHPRSTTVTRQVSCAPCFRSQGCGAMTCVREVAVDDVMHAVTREMARNRLAEVVD